MKQKSPHYLWLLRPYLRKSLGPLLLGSLSGILMNTLVVLPAVLLGRALDTALAFGRGQATASQAAWAAVAFLGGTLATQLPRLGKRWWLMTANARIRADLRASALRGILAWPMERLHGHSTGELMARINGDVEVLGVGIHDFTVETWDTILFTISVVAAMIFYDPGLTLWSLLPVPLALILVQASRRLVLANTTRAREANARLTAALQEQLAGLRLQRLFGRGNEAARLIEEKSMHLSQANFKVVQLREGLQPVYSTLLTAGVVLVIALGGQRVISGALSVGAFVGFMDLFLRFTSRAYRIPRLFNTIQAGGVAYERLRPLLSPAQASRTGPASSAGMDIPVVQPCDPSACGPLAVSVRRAAFRYPGASALTLKDCSLEIPAGSFVAVTGPVGSGKSALLRVILGLYGLERGEIDLDGSPFSPEMRLALAGRIGYLAQEPYLFSGDIRENIAFGPAGEVNPQRLKRAVRTAMLEPDLHALSAGLDTPVGERGGQVSGGQRQRIAMARSLAATSNFPGLLLLDDPFSAVDLDTEARLISSLREVFGPSAPAEQRATILLSSHRLAAFPQADKIFVLDRGQVCESGTHRELLAARGLYSRIYNAQTGAAQPVLPDHIRFPGEARPEDLP